MSDLIVVGTDTDVGKSTFCLLWLAAFAESTLYWKPLETGDPDSALIKGLIPSAEVHPPVCRFGEPVAPPLAAKREGKSIPPPEEIAAAAPEGDSRDLLIETFGSALSPLSDRVLQVELIRLFDMPSVLVCASAVGAIGRTLQSLLALQIWGVDPIAVILVGSPDAYAVEQIRTHHKTAPVFEVTPPEAFDAEGVMRAASAQRATLEAIRALASKAPKDKLADRGREGGDVVARDGRAVWHPYTSLGDPDPPLVVVDARDEHLSLADGRTLIDGISSWWTIQHGHRFPPLMKALREAASRYDHVHFAGMTHPPAVELAELMLATMPWKGGRVFYSDDGSTAVEVALKMAYQYWCHLGEPDRKCFVGFEGGYHGDTFGAMSVSRDPLFFGRFEPFLFAAEILPLSAERLDDFLEKEGEKVAGIIIEPLVQGAGGMIMHSPEVLRSLYEVARKHGVLFIADEVMTGGGRTGRLWAHQAALIAPDLVCSGKTIAGGVLPIAATLVAPEVVEAFDTSDRRRTFFHGHSFTAHPLACAVGVANFHMVAGGVGPGPANMERFWKEQLSAYSSRTTVKEVRVQGTIAAVELDVEGGYLADIGHRLRRTCIDQGVLLRPLGNVLYTMPPLRTSPESLDRIASAIKEAVEGVRS